MVRVTIHLPAEIEKRVREISEAAGLSVSAWISQAVKHELEQLPPPAVTRLFGSVPDLELPTRQERWSKDEP